METFLVHSLTRPPQQAEMEWEQRSVGWWEKGVSYIQTSHMKQTHVTMETLIHRHKTCKCNHTLTHTHTSSTSSQCLLNHSWAALMRCGTLTSYCAELEKKNKRLRRSVVTRWTKWELAASVIMHFDSLGQGIWRSLAATFLLSAQWGFSKAGDASTWETNRFFSFVSGLRHAMFNVWCLAKEILFWTLPLFMNNTWFKSSFCQLVTLALQGTTF